MLSKKGVTTIAGSMCFADPDSKGVKRQEHDFGPEIKNIDLIPMPIIKEKIRLTLMGVDSDVIQMYQQEQQELVEREIAERK